MNFITRNSFTRHSFTRYFFPHSLKIKNSLLPTKICYACFRTFFSTKLFLKEVPMDTIKIFLSHYQYWICSWWWLPSSFITFILFVAFLLMEDDPTLQFWEAMFLSFIGVVGLIPFLRLLVSPLRHIDFLTRWVLVGSGSFPPFATTMFIVGFLFSPLLSLVLLCAITHDLYIDTEFACDKKNYGLAVALSNLWGKGET